VSSYQRTMDVRQDSKTGQPLDFSAQIQFQ
jgi:hypothetical protein